MSSGGIERRLAAILSADIVGYSRLMAADQSSTVRHIMAYREQVGAFVREHRGRLVDFSGDCFLAEFSSPVDAAACAAGIQRELKAENVGRPEDRRMRFRIGIHLGDVRVEGERIYGDGVNIAARLQALAEPGGVCVSSKVRDEIESQLEFGY
ncbi:MAG: adenylate/guanylate cyclase domain-containing protein, partial [Deltaproteobacteria bacterium]|nr:adenylate/guanylate cyclase domain-containing protein [Deltaproteobacteria bacterium]